MRHRHPNSPAMSGVERFVTALACGWVLVLPWLIGGWLWWAQALSLVLGALALLVALSVRENRRALLCFPVFWLGLAFVAYVTCQACNPWLKVTQVAPLSNIWTLSFPVHVLWLPGGIEADYEITNTWRELVYWTGPWLLGCAWWVAAKRRRGVYWLWGTALVNSVLITFETGEFYFHASHKILWFWEDTTIVYDIAPSVLHSPIFRVLYVGAFINRDAAAIYLYLGLAAGLALALHTQRNAQATGRDTGLLWVVLTGCAVDFAGLLLSGSRAGLLVGAAILGVGALLLTVGMVRGRDWSAGQLVVGGIFLAGFLGGMAAFFSVAEPVSLTRLKEGMSTLGDDPRFKVMQATQVMIADCPWLGFGGGSYRYVSPYYFRKLGLFPDPTHYDGLAFAVYHAHCDALQLAMEYGALGAGLLLLILLYWAWRACGLAAWLGSKGWMVLVGAGFVLVHSCVDFPFFNAAVLTLFTLLVVSVVKLAELNRLQREDA